MLCANPWEASPLLSEDGGGVIGEGDKWEWGGDGREEEIFVDM